MCFLHFLYVCFFLKRGIHEFGRFLNFGGRRHSRRRDREPYPCYITDLDLSAVDPGGRMQTVRYLRYRQQLETALNDAMQALG